ncbi:MAG TPA: DNA replication and repair protein RecF [Candidatus Saccharimonadales bacterium]|nr:DNA replication and repair protein RecF [Candidatus Saccharimonadales bacterium]
MVLVKTIRVQHIRTHKDYTLDVSPGVSVVTGPNGSGKTSLIEALYIALQGGSFKGGDADVLQQDMPWYRIDVTFDDEAARIVKFDPSRQTGRKQFEIDGKTSYRLSPRHKYPVVLFEPDDLRLLNGSPTRRRQFIDRFISQLDPEYALSLRRYDRALKQRNTLLKRPYVSDGDLFAWNVSLSEYGAYIIAQRLVFIDTLNKRLNETYETIAHTGDVVTMRYSEASADNIQQKLLANLHAHVEKDKIIGFTSTGPHRHDVLFDFNHSPALSVASRGEVRSVVLALKFLEVDIIESITGKTPIILLDDVFSELDKDRQSYLIESTTRNQIIITSATGSHDIDTRYVTRL